MLQLLVLHYLNSSEVRLHDSMLPSNQGYNLFDIVHWYYYNPDRWRCICRNSSDQTYQLHKFLYNGNGDILVHIQTHKTRSLTGRPIHWNNNHTFPCILTHTYRHGILQNNTGLDTQDHILHHMFHSHGDRVFHSNNDHTYCYNSYHNILHCIFRDKRVLSIRDDIQSHIFQSFYYSFYRLCCTIQYNLDQSNHHCILQCNLNLGIHYHIHLYMFH